MQLLSITATCQATVTERWDFTLPDGYELPTDQDELHDFLVEVIQLSDEPEWDGKPIPVTCAGVEDEVYDERDREIIGHELCSVEPKEG